MKTIIEQLTLHPHWSFAIFLLAFTIYTYLVWFLSPRLYAFTITILANIDVAKKLDQFFANGTFADMDEKEIFEARKILKSLPFYFRKIFTKQILQRIAEHDLIYSYETGGDIHEIIAHARILGIRKFSISTSRHLLSSILEEFKKAKSGDLSYLIGLRQSVDTILKVAGSPLAVFSGSGDIATSQEQYVSDIDCMLYGLALKYIELKITENNLFGVLSALDKAIITFKLSEKNFIESDSILQNRVLPYLLENQDKLKGAQSSSGYLEKITLGILPKGYVLAS